MAISGPANANRAQPRAFVSLTYDDGLDSQLDVAVPQLDRAGMPGTFYLTWDNMKERAREWAALPRRGHELANHTMTHPCDLRFQTASAYARRQIDPLQRWLSKISGDFGGRDFAYPCDVTNLGPGSPNEQAHRFARLLRRSGVESARTSEGPPNSPEWVRQAPYRLQALALAYDTIGLAEVAAYLEKAISHGAWAILVIHEVGTGKRSNGFISPGEHQGVLDMISELRVECGTVQTGIRRAARS